MAKDRRAMVNPFAGIKNDAPSEALPVTAAEPVAATAVSEAETGPERAHVSRKAKVETRIPAREFVGFRLTPSLLDRARAVAWTQRLSLTAYVEAALEAAVRGAEHENGGPFPVVSRRLRKG
jgi:hypothetical protein